MLVTTNINHFARRKLGLSISDYCFMDMVQKLSTNPKSPKSGWCTMSKATMAEELEMTKRGVYKLISRLEGAGLIERDSKGNVRHTSAWYDVVVWAEAEKEKYYKSPSEYKAHAAQVVNSVHPSSELSSPQVVNSVHRSSELSSPNTINNTNRDTERDTAPAREIEIPSTTCQSTGINETPAVHPLYADMYEQVSAEVGPLVAPRAALLFATNSHNVEHGIKKLKAAKMNIVQTVADFLLNSKWSQLNMFDLQTQFQRSVNSYIEINSRQQVGARGGQVQAMSNSALLPRY